MFRTDPAIDQVKDQIREFHQEGFEIALHLHPQWCNARYENGKWNLDYTEYNLCTLSERRIDEIVGGSIAYLRKLLNVPDFTPLSFRAGNWLFQPTATAAAVLATHGIRSIHPSSKADDSTSMIWTTVELQERLLLEIRSGCNNPGSGWFYYSRFQSTREMVPFWKMFTTKRISLQQKAASRRERKVSI